MAEGREDHKGPEGEGDSSRQHASPRTRQPFVEPRLRFVEPKLVKHGDVTRVTAGFFGSFSP